MIDSDRRMSPAGADPRPDARPEHSTPRPGSSNGASAEPAPGGSSRTEAVDRKFPAPGPEERGGRSPSVSTTSSATPIPIVGLESLGSTAPAAIIHDPIDDESPTAIHHGPPGGLGSSIGDKSAAMRSLSKSLLGETLDHFEILDGIGGGGMGWVFRARDTRLDRLVAIKLLAPELTGDTEARRRFEQEAKAAARLNSPAFAQIHHYGFDRGLHFIAMEFVEGEDLRHRITRLGRIDPAAAVRIGMEIANCLVHAARAGVVHRDIKPSNIILTDERTAKLVDLGLARSLHSQHHELTQPGVTLGTFDYISPEQAKDPRTADIRSDIYSLGCTLFHALTGRPPYPDGSALQKLLAHQNEPPPDPRNLVPEIPDAVAAVLGRMMAKDPLVRYQEPGTLLADLEAVARHLAGDDPVSPSPSRSPAAGADRRAALDWLVPTGLFAAILLLVGWLTTDGDLSEPIREPRPEAPRVRPTADPTRAAESVSKTEPSASPVPSGPMELVVGENDDLAAAIRGAGPGRTLRLKGERYRLNPAGSADAELRLAETLTIRPDRDDGLVVIETGVVDLPTDGLEGEIPLFRVTGGRLTLQRVWLRVSDSILEEPRITAFSIDEGQVRLERCIVGDPNGPRTALVTFHLAGGPNRKGEVRAVESWFVGGRSVLVSDAGGQLDAQFLHAAVIEVTDPFVFTNTTGRAQWERSTVIGPGGPVFRLRQSPALALEARSCAFSRRPTATNGALLSIAEDDRPDAPVRWNGGRNVYHSFEALLARGETALAEDFTMLEGTGISDRDSRTPDDGELEGWPGLPSLDFADRSGREALAEAISLRTDGELDPVGIGRTPLGPLPARKPAATPDRRVLNGGGERATAAAASPPDANRRTAASDVPVVERGSAGAGQPLAGAARVGEPLRFRDLLAAAGPGRTLTLPSDRPILLDETAEFGPGDWKLSGPQELPATVRVAAPRGPGRPYLRLASGARVTWSSTSFETEGTDAPTAAAALFRLAPGSELDLVRVRARLGRDSAPGVHALFEESAGAGMPALGSERAVRIRLDRCDLRTLGWILRASAEPECSIVAKESLLGAASGGIQLPRGTLGGERSAAIGLRLTDSTGALGGPLLDVRLQPAGMPLPGRRSTLLDVTGDRGVLTGPSATPLVRLKSDLDQALREPVFELGGRDFVCLGFDPFQRLESPSGVERSALTADTCLSVWNRRPGELRLRPAAPGAGDFQAELWVERPIWLSGGFRQEARGGGMDAVGADPARLPVAPLEPPTRPAPIAP